MKKKSDVRTNGPLVDLWQETLLAHFVVSLAPQEIEPQLRTWRAFVKDFVALLARQIDQSRTLEENQWLMIDHLEMLLKAELRWLDTTIALFSDMGAQKGHISGAEEDQKPQGKEGTSCG